MRAETSCLQRKRIIEILIPSFVFLLLITVSAQLHGACSRPVAQKALSCNTIHAAASGWLFSVSDPSGDEGISTPAARHPAKYPGINWNWWIYSGILLLVLYIVRRYELSRVKWRNRMKIANIETVKFREIDQLKSRFYTNISHEFRTPLTLIKGPLEQMIEDTSDPKIKKTYMIMHSNVSRLLELINQLLDLSRIENGNYALKARQCDVVKMVEGLAMSYESLAEQKSIHLEVKINPEIRDSRIRNEFYIDPDILDKILINLISNAFKFTPENGTITFSLGLIRTDRKISFLEICIEDTGIGLEPDQLSQIFDRFYQVDQSQNHGNEGTGIGLSIVSELVSVHKGKIDVQSIPGKGTRFRVCIPAGKEHLAPAEIEDKVTQNIPEPVPSRHGMPKDKTDSDRWLYAADIIQPWVLVVEDHEQVRGYIIESIQKDYRILQAKNASDGFEMAEKYIPDLIISDVMMPGTDGYRFCEKLKNSEKTSHIPVILLTARAGMKNRIMGLKSGADDYLLKPFNANELRTRIANLIENRRALREKFKSNSIIRPGEISVTPQDAAFIEALLKLVESNIDNIHYSVEVLAEDLHLSQSQLHRKLKAITDMSALQFIISVRMHSAMELIQKDAGNIAEISYMVGYDDPGYFSKAFRKFFDMLPSEVLKK